MLFVVYVFLNLSMFQKIAAIFQKLNRRPCVLRFKATKGRITSVGQEFIPTENTVVCVSKIKKKSERLNYNVVPCGSSVFNLFLITKLAPSVLKRLLDF